MVNFITNIDNNILEFIRINFQNNIFDQIMPFITELGNNGLIWILIAIALIITDKYRSYGMAMLIALLLCFIIGDNILKPLFERIRPFNLNPDIKLLIPKLTSYSFPSSHAMAAFAAAIIILKANLKFGIVAFILAILISFSRIYLYVHYPSDVIAGTLIGFLIGLIALKVVNSKYLNQTRNEGATK